MTDGSEMIWMRLRSLLDIRRLFNEPSVRILNLVDPACKRFHVRRLSAPAPLGQHRKRLACSFVQSHGQARDGKAVPRAGRRTASCLS